MLITGCKDSISEVETDIQQSNTFDTEQESLGMTVLGKQLENPYSVENMKLALEELKKEPQLKSGDNSLEFIEFEVKTTHLYVRFLPKDTLELQQLEKDSLILFDYPLDYEIEKGGEYYHDPTIPEGQITWQYTTVKADYQFPANIKHEIIEECFILDEMEEEESQLKGSPTNTWALLETKALQMTDNLTKEEQELQLKGWFSGWFPKSKIPQGYIKVYDTELKKYVGVKGLTVRVHRLVKISYGVTDKNGFYKVRKGFRRNCFYGLRFESSTGVKLWKWYTTLTYARYSMGVHDESGYSRNIGTNSIAWRLATVMNGIYDYYNVVCPKYGITKPYSNLRICVTKGTVGGAPMLRRVYHPIGTNSNSAYSNFMINLGIGVPGNILSYVSKYMQPDIMIGGGSGSSAKIYSQTCHELAHASHFRKVCSAFWAKYISYILTYGAYGNGKGNNASLCALGEMWGYHMGYQAVIDKYGKFNTNVDIYDVERFTPMKKPFTPGKYDRFRDWLPKGILWDLNDSSKDIINSITDQASGFTNKQFYNALDSDVRSPQAFRNRLLKETNNRQKTQVDELFKAYYWN